MDEDVEVFWWPFSALSEAAEPPEDVEVLEDAVRAVEVLVDFFVGL